MAATEFGSLVESYLDLLWNVDPVAATAAGVAGYDGRLGAYDAEAVQRYLAALKSIGGSLEACDVESLDDEVDRTALLGEIRTAVHRFEHEQPHVRNPVHWVSHVLEGLHLLLSFSTRPRAQRARAAASRLREIPSFLANAQATLLECPRVFVETASQVAAQGFAVVDAVEHELTPEDDAAFPQSCADARKALAEFFTYLEDFLNGSGTGEFAIGEEAFNFRLHYQHALRSTAPELWRYGLHLVEEVEQDVAALARSIDAATPWQDVVARLREDHPSGRGLVEAYHRQMERARQFVAAHDLVTVPEGRLDVVATPPFLRPLIPFAAYQPPGAFATDRTGTFYVTPPAADASAPQRDRLLRDHSTHELCSTALHEGYPGHHLQFLTAHAQPRPVRRVVGAAVMVEGWALYCEEMMGEAGFYTSPEERLFQKVALLWRACRVVVDVGLHTRGMSFDDAVGFLVDRVHFERANAEAEVRRYCAEPVYQLSYAVGRRELLSLRSAYRQAHGSAFSLRGFHDAILRFGGLPVSLIRWGLGLDE
jgi:uncharacterized protein (DUF885 family)